MIKTNRCLKCNGLMVTEKTIAEGEWIEIIRCVNCGNYKCPPKNRALKAINKTVFMAHEKTKNIEGYNVYGIYRKRRNFQRMQRGRE